MITKARCSVCGQSAYRDRYGKMLIHTVQVVPDEIGRRTYIEVCGGWERGARP